jgi:hypothetical protein
MQQHYFLYPWAQNGDVTEIPNAADPSGYVSYSIGFGIDYQLELGTENAKNIERTKFNAALNDITLNLQDYQQYSTPEFIDTADNGGAAFAYDIWARCRYSNSGDAPFVNYVSLVTNNTETPGTGEKWADVNGRFIGWQAFGAGTHTFTMPAGPIEVTLLAAGSGGTGCTSSGPSAGACGGGGGWVIARIDNNAVAAGALCTIFIGSGSGGASAGGASAAGGNSTFSAGGSVLFGATGGGVAGNADTAVNGGRGGAGYSVGGAFAAITGAGEDGSDGCAQPVTSAFNWPGRSGSSYLGGGVRCGEGANGFQGGQSGAGGASAYSTPGASTLIGGAGRDGYCLIKRI